MVKKKILRQLGLDQVRVAASGSAPIPKEVIAWYRRLGLELLEGYGMTENFSYSHIGRPGRIRPGYVAPAPIENQLASSHRVAACYVTGSGYHQAHAVVMLSEEARQKANGEARDIPANELAALLGDVNRGLPPFEQLSFLAVAKDDWTVGNGFLAPTLKIKRRVLDATYGPLAESWYAMNAPVVWQEAA